MRLHCLLLAMLLLTACAARGPRVDAPVAEQQLGGRESALHAQQGFLLTGRLGISNGKDAGSGQFRWQQQGRRFDFQLTVTVTGDRFRLEGEPGRVRLTDAKGATVEGFDASELLAERTGWQIPVEQLGFWVRAMRAPGSKADTRFADDGRLEQLQQSGWTISYRRWNAGAPALPLMLVASRGQDRVRVKVRAWQ